MLTVEYATDNEYWFIDKRPGVRTQISGTGKATETGATYDGAEWVRSRAEYDMVQ